MRIYTKANTNLKTSKNTVRSANEKGKPTCALAEVEKHLQKLALFEAKHLHYVQFSELFSNFTVGASHFPFSTWIFNTIFVIFKTLKT